MRVPSVTKLVAVVTAGSFLLAAFVVSVAGSMPGDRTYGVKEAVTELRTALASGGEDRSDRYLDEVDLNIAELNLLTEQGASKEKVAETAERAVTTERHAAAELSGASDPETADRYQEHRQTLQAALRSSKQPAVRQSVRRVLRALPDGVGLPTRSLLDF
ncbi:MAG TPA: DUF5667 domain-containing protein [Patescibacteria group bacterium]|jgi:hypothetical protein